jgi:uncharacterized membrane protein
VPHPFFVHAPLVLIFFSAVFLWIGRKLKQDAWDLATLFVTCCAALTAVAAVISGFLAADALQGAFPDEVFQHRTNAIVITSLILVCAVLALLERRRVIAPKLWWIRAALCSFAAWGVFFNGWSGAQLVYVHGASVRASTTAPSTTTLSPTTPTATTPTPTTPSAPPEPPTAPK